ncbi:hypothetical protein OH460_08465 [Vibrio sp. Makdt]|uniref:hypothetical protein n=1 Tax=Vibrio sp. Makdt TaxID=2998828 RepID=UPI0022CD4DBE|nr:hypothetical protein [Vibrio sp. Makdt]MDA0152333.1 hypothetical protein [Vibrio sp. Makdt]
MAEHIEINLATPFFAPSVKMTLLEMVTRIGRVWPSEATCITQESDGELIWWSSPISEVEKARKTASLEAGLVPILGFGCIVQADYYQLNGQEVVATDWKTGLVEKDQL